MNIIYEYSNCKFSFFKDFASLLKSHKQEIINSFHCITDENGEPRRISNGPIEGYNRIPKDLKRNCRGFYNFFYVRSRLIWSSRDNEPILASPKSKSEVYKFKEKKK